MDFRTEQLIVFTRYPQRGATKTRLIPALGEAGAAALSRQMTEHTLAQVQPLQQIYSLNIKIYFTGSPLDLMQQWLGINWTYVPQGQGDLGDRMMQALKSAFDLGRQSVVIIGTDCPDLNTALLIQAFQELAHHDLVLGPAQDGGYYLIGLRRFVPELFVGISWSTAEVLRQTLTIAEQLGLATSLLPTLSDIDHPEDLAIWQRVKFGGE